MEANKLELAACVPDKDDLSFRLDFIQEEGIRCPGQIESGSAKAKGTEKREFQGGFEYCVSTTCARFHRSLASGALSGEELPVRKEKA